MLQTHFLRKKLKNDIRLQNSLQSTVYNLLPEDALVPKNNLLLLAQQSKDCKGLISLQSIINVVEDLVKMDCVQEFYGMKLEKILGVK